MVVQFFLVLLTFPHLLESRGNIAHVVSRVYWDSRTKLEDEADHKAKIYRELFRSNSPDQKVDKFSSGVSESEEYILLVGKRVFRENVTKFCSGMIERQLFSVSPDFRDAINFEPAAEIPSPIKNLTVSIPSRWFRILSHHLPPLFVCFGGEHSMRIVKIKPKSNDFRKTGSTINIKIDITENKDYHIQGVLILLDGQWNNHHLLPRENRAHVFVTAGVPVNRRFFTRECDRKMGIKQECCLWKTKFYENGKPYEYYHCQGKIPKEANTPPFISKKYETLVKSGQMSRRFLNLPRKTCHGFEYRKMFIERSNGTVETIIGLDAKKCAVFF